MDQQLLQRTRYLLQTRFRKLQTSEEGNFELIAKQVLFWLESHPIISSVIAYLDNLNGQHHEEISLILTSKIDASRYYYLTVTHDHKQEEEPNFRGYTPITLEEHASACLDILRAAVKNPNRDFYTNLAVYLTQQSANLYRTHKDALGPIKDIAIHDLYEFIDEKLDGINAVNGLLRKYKQNVEWFQRERVQEILENGYGGQKDERALAIHLQQYIFDQGVEFVIEPTSASGWADLLLRDSSGQYTIIDAKLIKSNTSASAITKKIADGFNQVARYCNDYNQPEGFLAVFIDDDITVLIDTDSDGVFKFFKIGGHIIYYIDINISDRPSASKAGKAKQVYITNEHLLTSIETLDSSLGTS